MKTETYITEQQAAKRSAGAILSAIFFMALGGLLGGTIAHYQARDELLTQQLNQPKQMAFDDNTTNQVNSLLANVAKRK